MAANSLLDGAAYFTAVGMRMEGATKKAVTKAARVVRDEARRVLGTHDYGWVPLEQSTIDHKSRGDTPLLETGEMRDSIQFVVYGSRLNWEAAVGSDNPKALWQELGTSHIPPRSFLAGAARAKEHQVRKICGHDVFASVFSHHPNFEDDWSYDGED